MMKQAFYIALVLCIDLQVSFGQNTNLTPELLFKLGRVSLDNISPDKKTILYGVTFYNLKENKGNRDLYLQAINSNTPVKLTSQPGNEVNARFTPDGKRVAYLFKSNLWEINLDGTNAHKLSDTEMSGFEFSPDGSNILFTADVKYDKTTQDKYPDLPLATGKVIDDLMYRHWDSWEDGNYSNVFYQNYNSGNLSGTPTNIMNEGFDTPLQPDGGIEQIAWSSDGKKIAYTCKKKSGKEYAISTNSDVYLYDLQTKETVNLTEKNLGYDMNPSFSKDGKYIAWSSMERDGYESDKHRIMMMDLSDPLRTMNDITKTSTAEAGDPVWSADSKRIYFNLNDQGTVQMAYYDLALGRIIKMTNGVQNYNGFVVANDFIVAEKTTMSQPQELVKINQDGSESAFTNVNTNLWNTIKKGEVKKRIVKTKDGQNMQVWVIYPTDFDPGKKYPTLLYCQGGPQSTINQFFSYRWNFQLMANNGYIIVAPNRRGVPSFGQEWNEEISGDYGGKPMQDLLSAIDDVAKEPYVDKDKLGAVGASFGGYSVYWLAGNHKGRFKTFIAHAGMYNITSWYGTTEESFFANWDQKGAYWNTPTPKGFDKFSPHLFVGNWDTPILVIHGEKDFRVPISEGMQAFNAAKLRGIPSKFLYFPDENHWVTSPQNSVMWQREYFEWLDTYLKPKPISKP